MSGIKTIGGGGESFFQFMYCYQVDPKFGHNLFLHTNCQGATPCSVTIFFLKTNCSFFPFASRKVWKKRFLLCNKAVWRLRFVIMWWRKLCSLGRKNKATSVKKTNEQNGNIKKFCSSLVTASPWSTGFSFGAATTWRKRSGVFVVEEIWCGEASK